MPSRPNGGVELSSAELDVEVGGLLNKKVFVTTDGPEWLGRTQPL